MERVSFDEGGIEAIPKDQRQKYAETLYAFFLEHNKMFPSDSDVVWDKENLNFVILDDGALRQADYGQPAERALLDRLIKRSLSL